MFKSDSIIVKITLLFIFSSISFILFVLYFINYEINKSNNIIEQRYNSIVSNISDLFKFGYDLKSLQGYLLDIGFYQVKDEHILNATSQRYFLLYGQKDKQLAVNSKKINGHYYIIMHDTTNNASFVYTDYKDDVDYLNYYLIALLAFIALIFFYILVLNSLLPLSALRREVKKFASGNMNIKVISNNKDEIGELSQEFAKAAYTINEMNKARVLFLRSIMHELRTPITKGRIVAEMITDTRAKNRLISVFTRLNIIIDDFAKIEEMSTKNYKISKTKFTLIELMQNINKMLLIEEDRPRNVILDNRDAEMIADFDAMSLSVKNLVDNAIKYSSNQKVIVSVEGRDLVVKNQGEPFKDDFNNYFQPFYSDGKENIQKGLGLGMYIIKHTIETQGFKLEYKYQDNSHYFYIKDCIVSDTTES
ncbi:hypothetical protein CCY99_09220 [Helicobacter sp. 16-1353]|uniref:ArsS family sensor histidine kinase n=1 Tax=Helicobacter sp. 16-1353 TaxID=2004996 RepID=UPI000DCC141D|nr:ArsS family sensor histidine kinase [Helicobacter sp. 16-1353]RAX51383.1 hypothetical protein CCY99_09220 [Helicobacter sp. 16-1353]